MINRFFAHCARSRIALGLAALSVLLWAHPAWAATRTVDTLVDSAGLTACTAAANDCSLRGALSGAGANDTINFAPSLANQTVTLTLGELGINQPVMLDGSTAPTVTVSGNHASRVINTSQPLTITSLIIQNGLANNANGGGIYASSDLWLIDSVIRNSVATGSDPNGWGGGVYVGGIASITGTSFLSNTADLNGGGACVNGAASITGTSFYSNTAVTGSGGGACVNGAASIMGTSFHSNTAGVYGGGVFVNSAASIIETSFRSNRAATGSGGGANVVGTASITETSFFSNRAHLDGGGVVVNSAASITGTTFLSNTAGNAGGGAWMRDAASITGTTFLSNTAFADAGGGAYVGDTASITGTTFRSNTARYGGGASVDGAANVTGTTFLSNMAGNAGGGAWVGAMASITGTSFRSNTAGNAGGGVWVSGTATVTGTTFLSNTAGSDGGGASVGGTASVADAAFLNNTAGNAGGGVLTYGAASITGTSFLGNRAVTDAGGGAMVGGAASITAATFLSNTAWYGGGAFMFGAASITGTTFLSNTAGNAGGGVLAYSAASITGTSFRNNTAQQGGGALFLYGISSTPASVVNSLFTRNRSLSNQGDALYMDGAGPASSLMLLHNTLANPTVEDGSAIYVRAGTVALTNTLIASHTIAIERVGGTVREDYSLFADVSTPFSGTVTAGTHSLIGAAGFVDASRDDYHLTAASAAIDMATASAVSDDLDGAPRPQSTAPDLGAFESPYGLPTLSVGDASVVEGNSGVVTLAFPITLSFVKGITVTAQYSTSDNGALAGSDYQPVNGTLVFAPGQTSQTIQVVVSGDSQIENNEGVHLLLSAAQFATLVDDSGDGVIINDDSPTLSIGDVRRAEGNSGSTSFVFTVTLSNPSALPITVTYATSDGSATLANSDYTAASGTLIVAPTIVTQTLTVNVVGDTSFESDETFTLTLSNPLGATLADGVAAGTIVNDDASPTALDAADEPTALPAHAYLPLVTR